jgi:hypothetical protein
MQFIQVKDDIIVLITAIQALNIHKGGKQKVAEDKEIETKPCVSIMLTMNAINVSYDTEGEARATYEAIKKVLTDYQPSIEVKGATQ